MAFQPGTWVDVPSNCTRSYTLTFQRCAEYGTQAVTQCVDWAFNATKTCLKWMAETTVKCIDWGTETTQQCIDWGQTTTKSCLDWAQQTSKDCCDWWPCSWACEIFTVIVSWICLLWDIVVIAVCLAWAIVVIAVCVAFAVIVSVVCVLFLIVVTVVCAAFAVIEWVVCLLWSLVEIVFCLSRANGGTMLLLTDGSVMVQECMSIFGASWATRRWWKLVPDAKGSYVNGTWKALADSAVARRYFGSAVLADGRVLVCGGEYTDASGVQRNDWNNSCEIYDPQADAWSTVPTPKDSAGTDWPEIGDPACTLLPDGTFLIGAPDTGNIAKFDPASMSWTAMNNYVISTSNEDSWVLMPDNTVVAPSCIAPPATCNYAIANDQWRRGNPLPTSIISSAGSEVGPGLLLYDGTALFLGGNQNTAIYNPAGAPQWTNGIAMPQQNGGNVGILDGPGVLLVNGNVLFAAAPTDSSGSFLSPCFYFEYDGAAFNRTADAPNSDCPTYVTRLLLLPNGETLRCREDDSAFHVYRQDSAALPVAAARPVVQAVSGALQRGTTVQISGLQFNGLSQAVAYGDDSQTATNYPLVRITNTASGTVRYCRTANHTMVNAAGIEVTSMGVATGAQVITTRVDLPADLETGKSLLEVIANGIPSDAIEVDVVDERKG